MCEPLTIASLALAGGSVAANMIGEKQRDDAKGAAITAEIGRENQIEGQSRDLFGKTIEKVKKPTVDGQVTAEAAQRTADDSSLIDSHGNYIPPTGVAPTEVGKSIARAGTQALAEGKARAARAAKVSAVGGVNQKLGIDVGRDGAWQGIFGNNIQRSAGVLPLELDQANRAGSTARGIGQILSAGSTAMGAAGMAKGAPGWGDLFGSAGAPVSDTVAGPTRGGFFARMFS